MTDGNDCDMNKDDGINNDDVKGNVPGETVVDTPCETKTDVNVDTVNNGLCISLCDVGNAVDVVVVVI